MKKYMRLKGNSSNKTMQNYVGTRSALSENKGITLVALVITIIVLLILAGVMTSLVMGENGVIAKAMLAREKATEADVLEDIRLKILEIRAENDGQATLEQLVIKLQNDGRYEYIVMKTSKYASLSEEGDIRSDNLVDTEISDYLKKEDSVIYITRNDVEVQVTNEMVPQIREKGILAVKTHILSFDANIQSLKVPRPKMLQEGQEETIDCTEEIPQREGFEFLGWSTKENPQEADLEYTAENNTFEMEDTDVTLYAVWKEIDKTQSVEGVAIIESIPETLTMTVGETKKLSAMLTPSTATNPNITWNSSDTSKATIDGNGLLTAVAAGTSTITVTTEDGNKTDTCTVTVAAAQEAKVLKYVTKSIDMDGTEYYANVTNYNKDVVSTIKWTDAQWNNDSKLNFNISTSQLNYSPEFYFDSVDLGLKEVVKVRYWSNAGILWYSDGYSGRWTYFDAEKYVEPGKDYIPMNSYTVSYPQTWNWYYDRYNINTGDYSYSCHNLNLGMSLSKSSNGTVRVAPWISIFPDWEEYDKNYGWVALRIRTMPYQAYITVEAWGYE